MWSWKLKLKILESPGRWRSWIVDQFTLGSMKQNAALAYLNSVRKNFKIFGETLYFNVGGLQEGPGKAFLPWSWKVLEFFVGKSVWEPWFYTVLVCVSLVLCVVSYLVRDTEMFDCTCIYYCCYTIINKWNYICVFFSVNFLRNFNESDSCRLWRFASGILRCLVFCVELVMLGTVVRWRCSRFCL